MEGKQMTALMTQKMLNSNDPKTKVSDLTQKKCHQLVVLKWSSDVYKKMCLVGYISIGNHA